MIFLKKEMLMKINVYDPKSAPRWVQFLNIINLFLLGFALGKFLGQGFNSNFIYFFTLYGCLYALVIGQFFIPKKEVSFPFGFLQHLKDQWSTT